MMGYRILCLIEEVLILIGVSFIGINSFTKWLSIPWQVLPVVCVCAFLTTLIVLIEDITGKKLG